MSDKIVSSLRFNNFSIDNMDFKRNYGFQPAVEEISLEFGLNAQALISEEQDEAVIILTCKIFEEEFKHETAPFYLELSMRGYFDCQGVDIDSFKFNGMAILLPYLRSVITSFTSQSGISPVILPPINVYKVFGEENDKSNPDR
jgi:preprotein translocase subunit SecB